MSCPLGESYECTLEEGVCYPTPWTDDDGEIVRCGLCGKQMCINERYHYYVDHGEHNLFRMEYILCHGCHKRIKAVTLPRAMPR